MTYLKTEIDRSTPSVVRTTATNITRAESRWTMSRGRTALAALATLAIGVAQSAGASAWTVVASGLDNPRGLDFAPNGALYVAEAGRGGGPGAPSVANAEGGTSYFGRTGAITRIINGTKERIVTGLAINDSELLLAGALPAAVLALLSEGFFEALQRWMGPRGPSTSSG